MTHIHMHAQAQGVNLNGQRGNILKTLMSVLTAYAVLKVSNSYLFFIKNELSIKLKVESF